MAAVGQLYPVHLVPAITCECSALWKRGGYCSYAHPQCGPLRPGCGGAGSATQHTWGPPRPVVPSGEEEEEYPFSPRGDAFDAAEYGGGNGNEPVYGLGVPTEADLRAIARDAQADSEDAALLFNLACGGGGRDGGGGGDAHVGDEEVEDAAAVLLFAARLVGAADASPSAAAAAASLADDNAPSFPAAAASATAGAGAAAAAFKS